MTAEHARLAEARASSVPWLRWGPYLSERQWGTVREDYSDGGNAWDYFSHEQARSQSLPMGRGRARRHLRRPAAPVLRAGDVERQGSDPEGAPVRPDQRRRQPRRGREGVLLLPRLHADALVHALPVQVPAGRLSVRGPGSHQPRAEPGRVRVRAARHRACSTKTATSTCSSSTPRPLPEDILIRCTVHNRGPEAATLDLLPRLWFRNSWSWHADAERPALAAGRRAARALVQAVHPGARHALPVLRGRCAAVVHRERDEHRAALRRAEPVGLRQGRYRRLHRPRPEGCGQPGADRDHGGGPLPADRGAGRVAGWCA